MILYDLKCSNGHEFDSWFSSAADFDKLVRGNLLSCVVCGDTGIEKAIMAPRVSAGSKRRLSSEAAPEQAVKKLRESVEKNADNVGREFAAEARKIHEGEAPERAIYGEARIDEAKSLIEDGVPVLPLPWSSRKVS